jgi:hypothetical protein
VFRYDRDESLGAASTREGLDSRALAGSDRSRMASTSAWSSSCIRAEVVIALCNDAFAVSRVIRSRASAAPMPSAYPSGPSLSSCTLLRKPPVSSLGGGVVSNHCRRTPLKGRPCGLELRACGGGRARKLARLRLVVALTCSRSRCPSPARIHEPSPFGRTSGSAGLVSARGVEGLEAAVWLLTNVGGGV